MVTQPYLNLLVKPRIFFRFSGKKNIISCILKGKMPFKSIKLYFFQNLPFKIHKIIFFFQKNKNNLKKMCVPTLPKIFRPVTRNTLIFFIGLA